MTEAVTHPAKYSAALIPYFVKYLTGYGRILDPFAGSGRIFDLQSKLPHAEIHGIEIEPKYAAMHPRTTLGNALHLPYAPSFFDALCTSPTYGNRMADHHNARDASKRNTYKHSIGEDLHPDNSGAMQWGDKYREFHVAAWTEAKRVLLPTTDEDASRFVLNTKDFYKTARITKKPPHEYEEIISVDEAKGTRLLLVRITDWHVDALRRLSFNVIAQHEVNTPGNRQGANSDVRIDFDDVTVLELRQS